MTRIKRRCLRSGVTTAVAVAAGLVLMPSADAQRAAPASISTPRAANGKPDLSGMWGGDIGAAGGREDAAGNLITIVNSRRCHPGQAVCSDHINQSFDQEFTGRMDPSRPLYKPEYWDRVQFLDEETNTYDPIFKCQPSGLPRVGPPARIVQTADDVIFLYAQTGAGSAPADYRIIPTDGRKHDPIRALDLTYYGDSVGHWERDTLVIDSVGFNDLTWLARGGYFHSDQMRVIERFRREGNVLHYDVTVEDPEVLLEPWVMSPRQVSLNTNPGAYIPEALPCKEYDHDFMVTKIRH